MWHRVKASPHQGARSIRRSMYVPYVVDTYQPKNASSRTRAYMKIFDLLMRWKAKRAKRAGSGRKISPRS